MKKLLLCSAILAMLVSSSGYINSTGIQSVYAVDEVIAEKKVEEKTEEKTEEKIDEKIDETKWHMNLHKAADAEFSDDGKTITMLIKNPGGEPNGGADKWDVQLRCRELNIQAGHKYKLTYDISSSKSGFYYSKIGNLDATTVGSATAGEVWHNQLGISTIKSNVKGIVKENKDTSYGDGWTMQEISFGDTLSVVNTFEAGADIPEAEWVFFLGGEGPNTPGGCFKEGTILEFTNMSLVDTTTSETLVSYGVSNITYGDIDGNGVIDINDLTMLSLHVIRDSILSGEKLESADVLHDGKVDIGDLAYLKLYLSGEEKITLG